MQSSPTGLIAKLVLPGSASCAAHIDQGDLAESPRELNPSQHEKVKGGRRSAPLRADPRQQQKLNEPFEERGRSAGTSVQVPGSGWQCPGLRKGTSALPTLCKGSQEIWPPYKAVAAGQVGAGRSSPLISSGSVILQAEPTYMCSGWFWRHLMTSATGLPS